MTVSITDNFTQLASADATTGWTSTGGGFTLYTDIFRQGTGCIGDQASSGTLFGYGSIAQIDASDVTMFAWLRSGNPTSEATGGFMMGFGDGTNLVAYYVGGNDNYGLFFNGWSSFKLNCANLPTGFEEVLGSEASFDITTSTELVVGFNYASKASGNSDNVFIDYIRYIANGSPGLTIAGGGATTQGTWDDVAVWDEAVANAAGVVAKTVPGAKAYELHFGVEIGDSGTGSSYFEDSNFQLFTVGTNMKAGAMDVDVLANATGTNTLKFDNFTVVGAGTPANWDMSSANINTMSLTNGQFANQGTFALPPTGGTDRKLDVMIFENCGAVSVNTCPVTNGLFSNSPGVAVIVPSGGGNDSDNLYLNCQTGKYYGTVGNYDVDGDTFSGCTYDIENAGAAATVNSDSLTIGRAYKIATVVGDDYTTVGAADNNVGTKFVATGTDAGGTGTVTEVLLINKINGANPTTVNNSGTNADTLIQGSVSLTITVKDEATLAVIENVQTSIQLKDSPYTQLMNEDTNASGVATETYAGTTGVDIVWKCRKSDDLDDPRYIAKSGIDTISTTGLNITVLLKQNPFI